MGSSSKFAALLLTLALSACGEGSPPPPQGPVTPAPIGIETPPAGSIYLGAYVSSSVGGISNLEENTIGGGYRFAIDSHYYSWVSLFPTVPEQSDISYGRLSLDAWDCGVPDSQIVAGSADPLIKTRALALKAFGKPIFLRYMWDANLPSSQLSRSACVDPNTDGASGGFSASEYVAAYRHIYSIFKQQGVNNVIWVWSYSSTGSDPSAYYPGSDVVDWIGVDAFNSGELSFDALFAPIYTFASQYGKPILISETGSVPNGQQAYLSSFVPAAQQYPLLDGIVYYDGSLYGVTWNFGVAGLTAIAQLAAQPYLSAKGTF